MRSTPPTRSSCDQPKRASYTTNASAFRFTCLVLVQLYWSERDGVYYVMRYAESGGRIDQVGRFYDLDAAIALGLWVRRRDEAATLGVTR